MLALYAGIVKGDWRGQLEVKKILFEKFLLIIYWQLLAQPQHLLFLLQENDLKLALTSFIILLVNSLFDLLKLLQLLLTNCN